MGSASKKFVKWLLVSTTNTRYLTAFENGLFVAVKKNHKRMQMRQFLSHHCFPVQALCCAIAHF